MTTLSTYEWPGAAHMKFGQSIWQYSNVNIKIPVCLDVKVYIAVVEVTF
jgi:hypothetical protein